MPTTFNVADFESAVRGYMISKIKEKYPELDTSSNSVFDDLFVKPMNEYITPLISHANTMEFLMNLNNAEYMTDDELDTIGYGNYKIERKAGVKASTSLTLSFSRIPKTDNLIIPTGAFFSTEDSIRFQTVQDYSFTPSELILTYNPSKLTYEVIISVEALDIGTSYNVSENQIIKIDTDFNQYLNSVTNKTAVTNGTDKELNTTYATRIKDYYISRHIGTKPGYEQFIYDNFAEIEDIYIAGYGDSEMMRDLVTIIKNSVPTDIHIGGKVDIYLKGCIYATDSGTVNIKSDKLKLGQLYADITVLSIQVLNLTDSGLTPVFTVIEELDGSCTVKLDNTGDLSYDPTKSSLIRVLYTYTGGSSSDDFYVGLTELVLNVPFKGLVSIYQTNDDTQTYTDPLYYEITHYLTDGTILTSGDVYYGTTKENVKIELFNMNTVYNGTSITVSYTINESMKKIRDIFDVEENRIITTDLMFIEATPVFINVGFAIKITSGQTLDDIKISALQNSLYTFFDSKQLGATIEESDMVGWLYRDTKVNAFMEYIQLPFISFYVPADPADAIIVQRDGTFIATDNIQYPALNKIAITSVV